MMPDLRATEARGARRAALALHAASDADRRWLLSQLEPAQRARVEPLLSELQALGLPGDAEIIRAVLESPVCAATVPSRDAAADWLQRASVRELARVLEGEPAALVADVMALLPVQRRGELLRRFPVRRRESIGQFVSLSHATRSGVPTRFGRALLEEMAARLQPSEPPLPLRWWTASRWRKGRAP